MKERDLEKLVKRVAMTIVIIAIAATIFSSCHTENKSEIKDPLEMMDLSMEGDIILESTTCTPTGINIDIFYCRGHEYMTVYTGHYQNMSQEISNPVHLTASCIGCQLEKEGVKFNNKLIRVEGHQYEFRSLENINTDSITSLKIKHYSACDFCNKKINYEQGKKEN
jgi:hypothetical protein